MEAVGTASSLLALITVAIQSTKVICEAISAFKDGPEAVRRLGDAANELLLLLEQFERCEPRLQATLGQHGPDVMPGFHAKVGECANRMKQIRDELQPYQQNPRERRRDKIKRALKTVFEEKKIENWWREVQNWITLFGAYIGKLGLDFNISHSESNDLLHNTMASATQSILAEFGLLESHSERRSQNTITQLENISSDTQTLLQQGQLSCVSQQHAFQSVAAQFQTSESLRNQQHQSTSDQLQDINRSQQTLLQQGHLLAINQERAFNALTGTRNIDAPYFDVWSGLQQNSNEMQADVNRIARSIAAREDSLSQLLQGLMNEVQQLRIAALNTQSQVSNSRNCRLQSGQIMPGSDSSPFERSERCNESLASKFADRMENLFADIVPSWDELDFMDSKTLKTELIQLLNILLQHWTQQPRPYHVSRKQDKEDRLKEYLKNQEHARSDYLRTATDILKMLSNFNLVLPHEPVPQIVPWLGQERDFDESFIHSDATNAGFAEKPSAPSSPRFTQMSMPGRSLSIQSSIPIASSPFQSRHQFHNLRKRKIWNSTQVLTPKSSCNYPPAPYALSPEQFQQTNHMVSFGDSNGMIDIHFRKTKTGWTRRSQSAYHAENAETREVFETKFVLTPPSHLRARGQIALTFSQEQWQTGSLLSIPRLSIRRIIPDDSEIFDAIKRNSLEDVSLLFRENKFFVTDRKPNGRSLLSVALEYMSPNVVQYLVDQGAEIDSVERASDSHNERIHPAITHIPGGEISATLLHSECYRIMLRAGADLLQLEMAPRYGSRINDFGYIICHAPLSTLSMVLELGRPFVNVNHVAGFAFKKPALVCLGDWVEELHRDRLVDDWEWNDWPEKIIFLISHGADVNAIDEGGNMSLHAFLRVKRPHVRYSKRVMKRVNKLMWRMYMKDILTLLTTAGADVDAINNAGQSPSDIAKASYNDDLWKEVLMECGYDFEKCSKSEGLEVGCSTAIDDASILVGSLANRRQLAISYADYLKYREESGIAERSQKWTHHACLAYDCYDNCEFCEEERAEKARRESIDVHEYDNSSEEADEDDDEDDHDDYEVWEADGDYENDDNDDEALEDQDDDADSDAEYKAWDFGTECESQRPMMNTKVKDD